MFSTFTGSTKRPRNVNLSGAAGNPFSNTSWTPSAVSNPTKAVNDAQAEREKRQADRQRLRAAGQIQRTWRAHQTRRQLSDDRRATFDQLYASLGGNDHAPSERLHFAFNLLLAFFTPTRNRDLLRLLAFTRDCEKTQIEDIPPAKAHKSRITRFAQLLTSGMQEAAEGATSGSDQDREDVYGLQRLASRVVTAFPQTLARCANSYFAALSVIFTYQGVDDGRVSFLFNALSAPFLATSASSDSELKARCYEAFASRFLAQANLALFENNIDSLLGTVELRELSNAIRATAEDGFVVSTEQQLWQLAHFIAMSHNATTVQLDTLQAQLADLSSEISLRLGQSSEARTDAPFSTADVEATSSSLDPYISHQLMSLVDSNGLSQLIQNLSAEALVQKSEGSDSGGLSAYISTLLLCFPNQADEIRMRLFLSTISTSAGEMPVFKYIWYEFKNSSVFNRLATSFDDAIVAMRQYFHDTFKRATGSEWRVAVMFLELYIFVLRLSDDDDFFSAMSSSVLDNGRSSTRLQSCSLALPDLEALTAFLKNAAFAIHYKTREISEPLSSREKLRLSSPSRTSSQRVGGSQSNTSLSAKTSARLEYGSLKNLITTTTKMLYERDSRKQFLPSGHWLMSSRLEKDDFIGAVVAEEMRRREEEDEASGSESDEDDISAPGQAGIHARAAKRRRDYRELLKQRRMAEMGPKLEILKHMPFVVPFETRVKIFRHFISLDQTYRDESPGMHGVRGFHGAYGPKNWIKIRRGHAFDDAYKELYQLGEDLKNPIMVTFQDQWGSDEAGIDGGGVTKEFLLSVTNEALARNDSEPTMFTSSYNGLLYPDPKAMDVVRNHLRQRGISEMDNEWMAELNTLTKRYEFLGRIIGKCMYEGILVDIVFAGFFLLQWSSAAADGAYKGSINDLRDIDEELYKGMLRLKDYTGDVSELDLTFTINDQVSLPGEPVKTVTRALMPNGDNVQVTNDNRLLYISYVARHRLVAQSAKQTSAFLRGLREIIRPSWLSMFNQIELQRLVGGDSSEIDIDDLRQNTVYSGLYVVGDDNEEHPTIKLFWKVLRAFTDQQRRDVLKYVSSTPRAPLLGFSQLTPKFSIRDSGSDETRLPSTSTCVNLLKLPRYSTEKVLREKLLYAVTSGAGFDLS